VGRILAPTEEQKNVPGNSQFMKDFSEFADRVEKVVFSKSLQSVEWPNSRIARGDPAQEIALIRGRPGGDLALGGGPRLIQSFIDQDLVDELLIDLEPSIVGYGKPFFRVRPDPDHEADLVPLGATGRHDFRTVEAKVLRKGEVYLHYRRAT
jgi:dihydrofolate reductase